MQHMQQGAFSAFYKYFKHKKRNALNRMLQFKFLEFFALKKTNERYLQKMQITCNAEDWQYAFVLYQNAALLFRAFNALMFENAHKKKSAIIIKHLRA